jgi:regulator of replication initiation timing
MLEYSNEDIFKKLTELKKRCDDMENKITGIETEHKNEISTIKENHKKEVKVLYERIDILTKLNKELKKENQILKADNTRMKSTLSNNSSNTSLQPSKDQKGKGE